jgi:hypothetical protein
MAGIGAVIVAITAATTTSIPNSTHQGGGKPESPRLRGTLPKVASEIVVLVGEAELFQRRLGNIALIQNGWVCRRPDRSLCAWRLCAARAREDGGCAPQATADFLVSLA